MSKNQSLLNSSDVQTFFTAWKVSKYGVFSGPYFPVFSPNTRKFGRKKIIFWTLSRSVLFVCWIYLLSATIANLLVNSSKYYENNTKYKLNQHVTIRYVPKNAALKCDAGCFYVSLFISKTDILRKQDS